MQQKCQSYCKKSCDKHITAFFVIALARLLHYFKLFNNKKYDQEIKIRRIQDLLPEEKPKDKQTPQPGHLLYTCCCKKARTGNTIFQKALKKDFK